jgi:hypothetical protein
MKCRQFEQWLPDWIADRLSAEQADRMAAHSATCPICSRAADGERALRRRWQDLPQAAEVPALWPRLAQRIEVAPHRRRSSFLPVFATMSSAVAAFCLVCLLVRPHPIQDPGTPFRPRITASTDDSRIVQLASQIQQLPEGESDAFFAETQQDRRAMRLTIHGKEAE